jgi:hypothetical protein
MIATTMAIIAMKTRIIGIVAASALHPSSVDKNITATMKSELFGVETVKSGFEITQFLLLSTSTPVSLGFSFLSGQTAFGAVDEKYNL